MYYAFRTKNFLFLVMEYLPGGDLGTYIKNCGSLSEEEVKIYAAELVLALEDLHESLFFLFFALYFELIYLNRTNYSPRY